VTQHAARDGHAPGGRRAKARDRLRQLALTVPGDAGDGHDLAGARDERDVLQRRSATIVVGADPARLEDRLRRLPRLRAAVALGKLTSDHQRSE
jgi:hypothetical protein